MLLSLILGATFIVLLAWACVFIPVTTESVRLSVWRRSSVLLLATVLAVGVYIFVGSMPALRHHWVTQKEQHTAEAILKTMSSKQVVIDRLEALLSREPNRPKGWALLGRIRMSQGETNEAITAYQNAWHLDAKNLSYAVGLGEALLLANKPFPDALLTQCQDALVASHDPQEKAALLNVLAIHAYRMKHYQEATSYWKKALGYYPVGSLDEKQLLEMIHKAQQGSG